MDHPNSGGQGDCGYLKTTGGRFSRFEEPGAVVYNDKGWGVYFLYSHLPKSMGGGAESNGHAQVGTGPRARARVLLRTLLRPAPCGVNPVAL